MDTIEEIQRALERLPRDDRAVVSFWLQRLIRNLDEQEYRVEEPRAAHQTARQPYLTFEEYLEFEERSPIRHEYVNGVVHAMSGASLAHNGIAGNLFASFHAHLRGGPCKALVADMKLYLKNADDEIAYYPDVMVACERDRWTDRYVRDPKLVIEVQSPSTRNIDLREKLINYRRIASVEEYIIAAQDARELTIHRRASNWIPELVTGKDAVAEFRSIDLSLPLAQVYEDVPNVSDS